MIHIDKLWSDGLMNVGEFYTRIRKSFSGRAINNAVLSSEVLWYHLNDKFKFVLRIADVNK